MPSGYPDHRVVKVRNLGRMQANASAHAVMRPRSVADAAYLEALAERLADAACLPITTARRRVMQMAISAQSGPGAGAVARHSGGRGIAGGAVASSLQRSQSPLHQFDTQGDHRRPNHDEYQCEFHRGNSVASATKR
jgi:hypothetical protein